MFSLERRRECYRTLPKLCRSPYSRKDSNNYSNCRLRNPDTPETHNFFFTGGNFKSRRFTVKDANQWRQSWATVVCASTFNALMAATAKLHLLYVRYFRTRATDEHVTLIFYPKDAGNRFLRNLAVICKTIGVPPQKIWMSKCQFPFSCFIFQLVVLQDVSP